MTQPTCLNQLINIWFVNCTVFLITQTY